jgi:hypothetical protein
VIPAAHRWLFWDVDPEAVDLDTHADYVLERVMARGDWAAMRWLSLTYSAEARADFLRRLGSRLAPRERAYWRLLSGLPNVGSDPGGGRPAWAG